MTTWYERLSFLDSSFLAFEGVNSPMHIGGVAVFEAGSLATSDGGIDVRRIRHYVESGLSSVPRYRQRLAYIPLENHPVWVDDDHFDLTYHVRHISLPRPGDERQLQEQCARLLERRLDRAKPLWEIWVIEGVAGGRFALLMKTHHCMADGLGGVELLATLLRPTPDPTIAAPSDWQPRPAPSHAQLLRDEVARRADMSIDLVRRLRHLARDGAPNAADWGGKLKAVWRLVTGGVRVPVATPLNPNLGPHRRFCWTTSDLSTLREVKAELGGTVNDVVLTVVSGAVRNFFERRGFPAGDVDFRAAVPVNRREASEQHNLGNRVSVWLMSLPIHERHSTRRLQAVRDMSHELKDADQAVGVELLMQTAEWTSANVLTVGTALTSRVQAFNLIVTNVPGPQFPLYLLGARMQAIYPQVPLFEGQGLGIALFSYAGKLFWGFNGDWDALPDLDEFVHAIETALWDLRRAARRHRRRTLAAQPRQPLSRVRPARPIPLRPDQPTHQRTELQA